LRAFVITTNGRRGRGHRWVLAQKLHPDYLGLRHRRRLRQGLAYAAGARGSHAQLFAAAGASRRKVEQMRALGAHVSARTDAEAAASEYAAAFADRLLVVDGRRRRPNQRLERHRPRRHRTHRRNPHAQHLPEAQNPRQRRPPPPRHPSSPTSAAEHTRPARNARVRAPAADNAIRLRAVASQATEATILISHLVLCRGRRSDGSAGQVLGSRSSQSRRLGDLALGPTSAVTAGTPVAHHAGPPARESGSDVLVSDFVLVDVGLEVVGDGGQGAGL
jgi:hypothetical protein